MNDRWKVLAATHLLAAGAGFALAPRDILDQDVSYTGMFSVQERRTIAAAVLSLQKQNKLLAYTYVGAAHVEVEQSELLGLLDSSVQVTVGASVSYFVDLSNLSAEDVSWDAAGKVLRISLPPLVLGEIALEPERASIRSSGLMTLSDRHVQRLTKAAYRRARVSLIAQAQQETIREAAEEQARVNIQSHLELPLRAVAGGDIRVLAAFRARHRRS
jgi:hypothetical protein